MKSKFTKKEVREALVRMVRDNDATTAQIVGLLGGCHISERAVFAYQRKHFIYRGACISSASSKKDICAFFDKIKFFEHWRAATHTCCGKYSGKHARKFSASAEIKIIIERWLDGHAVFHGDW